MPLDVLGCTRAAVMGSTILGIVQSGNLLKAHRDGDILLQLSIFNEEFLVNAKCASTGVMPQELFLDRRYASTGVMPQLELCLSRTYASTGVMPPRDALQANMPQQELCLDRIYAWTGHMSRQDLCLNVETIIVIVEHIPERRRRCPALYFPILVPAVSLVFLVGPSRPSEVNSRPF